MTRLWPSLLDATRVVQPETILRWHHAGFKAFWHWKSRKKTGRPKIDRDLRDLIRRMSKENPKWGSSRIHGELLMLGFEVAQSTVSKKQVLGLKPPPRLKQVGDKRPNQIEMASIATADVPIRYHGANPVRMKFSGMTRLSLPQTHADGIFGNDSRSISISYRHTLMGVHHPIRQNLSFRHTRAGHTSRKGRRSIPDPRSVHGQGALHSTPPTNTFGPHPSSGNSWPDLLNTKVSACEKASIWSLWRLAGNASNSCMKSSSQ